MTNRGVESSIPTAPQLPVESLLLASGWQPELATLEHSQLIAADSDEQFEINFVQERAISAASESVLKTAHLSALVSEVLRPHHTRDYTTQEEHIEFALQWCEEHLKNDGQTIAVRSHRQGLRLPDWSGRAFEQALGGRLHAAGWKIDLESPDITFRVISLNHAGEPALESWETPVIAWGVQVVGPSDWDGRTAPNRPFFKPVSLDPRVGRAMVNLACPGGGRLLDPFCGTGGILIEAVLAGLEVCGSDLDGRMVAGSLENLEWAKAIEVADEIGRAAPVESSSTDKAEPDVRKCSATEAAAVWQGEFDGFAFDPPYGRNSWKSDDGWGIFEQSLDQCSTLASDDANLVTLLPWSPEATDIDLFDDEENPRAITFGKQWLEVVVALEDACWCLDAYIHVPVHGSLSRLLIVCSFDDTEE